MQDSDVENLLNLPTQHPPELLRWRRRQAMRPIKLLLSFLFTACFVVFVGWLSQKLEQPTKFDEQLQAATHASTPLPWSAPYAIDTTALASIDFEKVHARLLPEWVIALQHDPYTLGRDREARRFEALMTQVGNDPNLSDLLRRLRDRVSFGVSLHALEITYLWNGWNDYLQQAALPWHVAHDLVGTARGGRMYIRCYHVDADMRIEIADSDHHVRVVARVDGTNIGELFFGQTSVEDHRAMVVSDRVAEYVLDRIWPMMDPDSDKRLSNMDRAFAPLLRQEAQRSLSPATLQTLQRGAFLHRALDDRLSEIIKRKGCGRSIEVDKLAWNGLSERGRAIVARAATYNAQKRCSRLTQSDADFLLSASNTLSSDEKLHAALERLAAWMTEAVTVHEARHLADDVSAKALSCDGCPGDAGMRMKAEISAYVASFGSEKVGYLSLYQACGVDTPGHHESASALGFLLRVLAPNGCDAPPANLYEQARLAEWILFKRVEKIQVPSTFPQRVALPSIPTSLPSPDLEPLSEAMMQSRHTLIPSRPLRTM